MAAENSTAAAVPANAEAPSTATITPALTAVASSAAAAAASTSQQWIGVQTAADAFFLDDTKAKLIGAHAVTASVDAPCSSIAAAPSPIAAAAATGASSPPLASLSAATAADRLEDVAKRLALQQARQQSTLRQCFAQLQDAAAAHTDKHNAALRRIEELEFERAAMLSTQQENERATAARFAELSAAHLALLSAHSETAGASQRRIAELETERASLLSRLTGVKQEQMDTEEECIKAEQLKRMGERQLAAQREKLRVTENQLHQQSCEFAAHRAHLASVAEQLSARRHEVSRLESEHADLVSLLQTRSDDAQVRLSGVKLERDETKSALEQTTQHKRKAEEERDDASKRARDTAVQLARQTEELDQLNCVICEESRASILYLPCEHAPCCDACDDDYQGGPRRDAAAGPRTCPICRADIERIAKPHIGH